MARLSGSLTPYVSQTVAAQVILEEPIFDHVWAKDPQGNELLLCEPATLAQIAFFKIMDRRNIASVISRISCP